MSKIHDMRTKRAEIWDAAKKFLDEHQDEQGRLSAEDEATYERMEQEVVDLGHAIDRAERAAQLDRELNAPANSPLTSRPDKGEGGKRGLASDEYKNAFWKMVCSRNGHVSVQNALQIGTDSEGGYLCPDEFERTLIKALEDENKIRSLCRVIRTESGERKIPIVSSRGTASWVDEEGPIPESDDVFGQISLGAHKVATMIKVSDELLQDSVFDVEGYISYEFGRRMGAAEEEAFITGDGAAKPFGLLHETNGAQIGVTASSGTAFTADELLDLVYSLRSGYRRKAKLIMNDSTIKALRKLKDLNNRYMWEPSLKEGEPDKFLSYPIVLSAFMPEIGAGAKPILFGDLSYYWIADRQGRTFQRLNELYAPSGQVGFRATQRVDARLVLPEAVKCLQMKSA